MVRASEHGDVHIGRRQSEDERCTKARPRHRRSRLREAQRRRSWRHRGRSERPPRHAPPCLRSALRALRSRPLPRSARPWGVKTWFHVRSRTVTPRARITAQAANGRRRGDGGERSDGGLVASRRGAGGTWSSHPPPPFATSSPNVGGSMTGSTRSRGVSFITSCIGELRRSCRCRNASQAARNRCRRGARSSLVQSGKALAALPHANEASRLRHSCSASLALVAVSRSTSFWTPSRTGYGSWPAGTSSRSWSHIHWPELEKLK